jgi:hypothetical protein
MRNTVVLKGKLLAALTLFYSYISINWRAKPLTSLEVVIRLISNTTDDKGLTVTAVSDCYLYPTGIPRHKERNEGSPHCSRSFPWRLELYD